MRIYLHEPHAEPALLEDVNEAAKFRDICSVDDETFVFLDDQDEPVDVDAMVVESLAKGRNPGHHHVHRHPCRQVTVDVHYGGDTRPVQVTPNQTVGKVLARALKLFGIDAASGSDLVLRHPGSSEDLPQSQHIGDLDVSPTCKLELNLLPAHREAG